MRGFFFYHTPSADGAWWSKRFRVDHEYMPVFVKGEAPKYFNKEHVKVPSKHAGKIMNGGTNRNKNGITQASTQSEIHRDRY